MQNHNPFKKQTLGKMLYNQTICSDYFLKTSHALLQQDNGFNRFLKRRFLMYNSSAFYGVMMKWRILKICLILNNNYILHKNSGVLWFNEFLFLPDFFNHYWLMILQFFFCQGFLSWTFANHVAAGGAF